jgi:hypothetical protein
MSKKSGHDPSVTNRIKIGSPRRPKRKKGNTPACTSRSGNGKRIR